MGATGRSLFVRRVVAACPGTTAGQHQANEDPPSLDDSGHSPRLGTAASPPAVAMPPGSCTLTMTRSCSMRWGRPSSPRSATSSPAATLPTAPSSSSCRQSRKTVGSRRRNSMRASRQPGRGSWARCSTPWWWACTVSLPKLLRLADFAAWATACETSFTHERGVMIAYHELHTASRSRRALKPSMIEAAISSGKSAGTACLHCHRKRGDFAVRHVIAPAFHHLQRATLLEHHGAFSACSLKVSWLAVGAAATNPSI